MNEIKWGQVITTALTVGLVVGLFIAFVFPREVPADCPAGNETICPEVNETICPEIDTEGCPVCKTYEEQEQDAIITGGYLIDDLFLGEGFSKTLSDREIYLFDDEIDFDGDDYDADEFLILTDITLKANENDFEGNVYLTMLEGSVYYKLRLESKLDTSNIKSDETLQLEFLGEDITISDWDVDDITFTQGKEYLLTEGESIVVNEKNITLDLVLETVIYVSVDGVSERIDDGFIETVNGLEIKAEYVLYDTRIDRTSKAMLIIGENIETTISDGDTYGEDEVWTWVIDESSIGIALANNYIELDNDDGYNSLASNKVICLPNDYVCVLYNGLIGGDEEEYNLEFDSGSGFVEVNGNFLDSTDEYDKVYINSTGIYDDNNGGLLIGTTVNLGDTNSILNMSTGSIVINDFTVNLDLNVTNVGTSDEDYRTDYGIFIENPEDSVDRQEFTITVPEEKLEGIITVKKGGFEGTESVCDVDNLDLCLDETTCTDAEGYWYDDVCNLEEETTE